MNEVFNELSQMWEGTDKAALGELTELICASKDANVIGLGAGRMGYAIQAFVMRLSHLGYTAYMIGDTSLPRVSQSSIVVVNTSSGETPSIKLYVEQSRKAGCRVVVLTSKPESSIARLADLVVTMPSIDSSQLMKTVYEQYTFILFDYISKSVFEKLDLEKNWVEQNHSILE